MFLATSNELSLFIIALAWPTEIFPSTIIIILILENVLISLWNSHLFVNTYLSGEGKMLKSRWTIIIPKGFVLASLWNRYLFVYFLKTFWLFCEILVNENVKSKRGHPMTDHS